MQQEMVINITVQQENFEDQNLHEFYEKITICEIIIHIILGVTGSQS